MSKDKNQLNELGYDVLGLSKIIYAPVDSLLGDSCDGGCTIQCVSCKSKKKNGVEDPIS